MNLSPTYAHLTRQQVGQYAEYYVKMAFTLHAFDVYTAEVDDKGIDFVIRKDENVYYDVQVKSIRKGGYIFLRKDKCCPRPNLLVAIAVFVDGQLPDLYLVPATVWLQPNALFVSHDYPGLKSKPEWGINITKTNQHLLEPYRFEAVIHTI
jgi:hypothetical protein